MDEWTERIVSILFAIFHDLSSSTNVTNIESLMYMAVYNNDFTLLNNNNSNKKKLHIARAVNLVIKTNRLKSELYVTGHRSTPLHILLYRVI